MSDNVNENSEQNKVNDVNEDSEMNPANNLLLNQNSIDMNSIMRVATNLLNNGSVLNTIAEFNKRNQIPASPQANVSENRDTALLTALSEKLDKMANEISELKQAIRDVKEQNSDLKYYMKRILRDK